MLASDRKFTRRQMAGIFLSGSLMLACSALPISSALAGQDAFVLKCHAPTPSVSSSNYPGVNKIILSNNLARPAGKAINANGQLLFLSGRITDENCVPISNAIVDIWQTNPFGEYRWAARDELLNPEPIFAGSGRAVTDNLGRYQFTTLFPGGNGKNAPHIYMRIQHPDFKPLDTSMYFRGDRRNSGDPKFRALKSDSQALLLGNVSPRDPLRPETGLDAVFNITLGGRNVYRSY